MNEQLQNQLAEVVKKALEAGQNAADFAALHAPDVVAELLRWHFWSNTIAASLAIAMATVFGYWAARGIAENTKHGYLEPNLAAVGAVFGTIFSLASGIAAIPFAFQALQVAIAPKLFLVEYIAKLVK